jgi:hypothetical protein
VLIRAFPFSCEGVKNLLCINCTNKKGSKDFIKRKEGDDMRRERKKQSSINKVNFRRNVHGQAHSIKLEESVNLEHQKWSNTFNKIERISEL